MPSPTLVTVNELTKMYGSETILQEIGFQIADREHVAVVGVNGAGKSTILRILAGIEYPTSGSLVLANGLRVTYLPQEANFNSDRTVREEARSAFAPVLATGDRMRAIEREMTDADDQQLETLLEEYARLQTRFETAGGYDIEHRTDEVLSGLGFTLEQFSEPVNHLSGGQKTRVALVKALLADPDLLLLDEPTNHLDLNMLEWLESFLRNWGGACLIVSHDRYFLDRVTTRTLEVIHGRVEDYPAPYTRYLVLREEQMTRRLKEYEEQQAFIARTEEFIRKYKAGQRAREAKGRQTRLDRLERIERPQETQELSVKIAPTVRSGQIVLSAGRLRTGYPARRSENGGADNNHVLVETPELTIERGDRVALIGPNGSGKTTLLKTFVGELETLKGRFHFGTNVKLGYYAQGHEQLGRGSTPLSTILDAEPMGEESARNFLGRFLFSDDDVFKSVDALSGGERSRLALALLLLQHANFLVLDEPTNHLDISAREALEDMLTSFDGTILFVSHDRYFIDRIATRVWAVDEGTIQTYLGNYTDYQRQLGRRPETPPEPVAEPQVESTTVSESTNGRRPRRQNEDARLQKNLSQIERDVSQLEGKLNELSDALAIASIDKDVDAVTRLGAEYERVQNQLNQAYEQWETLTTQVEALVD